MIELAINHHSADGPEITKGPSRQYATVGDHVSLICGYNLKSNPFTNVTWSNPSEERVLNSGRYTMDDGPEVVQLNISDVTKSDSGTWRCSMQMLEEEKIIDISLSVLGMQ